MTIERVIQIIYQARLETWNRGDGPSLRETSMLQVIIRELIKPALQVEH